MVKEGEVRISKKQKDKLIDSVTGIHGTLRSLDLSIDHALRPVRLFRDSMEKAGQNETNEQIKDLLDKIFKQLDDLLANFQEVRDNITTLQKHTKEAMDVTTALRGT
jgi:hypothetical protein